MSRLLGAADNPRMPSIDVVIMAAGKGTRMKSRLPKVLHRLGGRPLLQHVIVSVAALHVRRIVVITGNEAAQVEAAVAGWEPAGGKRDIAFVRQEPQLGTGHAVQQAEAVLPDDGIALILNGDVPLITAATLQSLAECSRGTRLALLTVDMGDPTGYGRVLRTGEAVRAIVEHKDANEEQRRICEVYTGFMAVPNASLKRWLAGLTSDN